VRVLPVILALPALGLLAISCRTYVVGADDGVVTWAVREYDGTNFGEDYDELVAGSVAHNGGVADQIEFVLEHGDGWQRAGVDFRRASEVDDGEAEMLFLVTDFSSVPCGSHGQAAGCAGFEDIDGDWVCLVLTANRFRGNYIINHEVGHCLGLDHLDIPGVMTYDLTQPRSWPSDEEIRLARDKLD
jgi:hypothetical protein